MKYLYLQIVFILVAFQAISQNNFSPEKVRRQPYYKYNFVDRKHDDTITYYISEFDKQKALPLIVFIQGSGNSSLFNSDATGKVVPKYGHISLAYASEGKAKVLIIEKPGVGYLDSISENKDFDKKFSLERWSVSIVNTINLVLKTELIDTSKILVVGHSEGGVVASRVSCILNKRITHAAILAGEGASQLFSLYKFAESGIYFDSVNKNKEQRIDSLENVWKEILAEPLSTQKKFWGFTYLRWSSFLRTSPLEELSSFNGKILILQGENDKNVYPESAKILYTGLLSKGRNVKLQIIKDADHSFSIKNSTQNDWDLTIKRTIDWFLN